MDKRELQRKMYEVRSGSRPQRMVLAALAGLCFALAWWMLAGGGLVILGDCFGRRWQAGNPVRRILFCVGFSIYYVRILFTKFVFLKRGVSWSEVFSIAPWLLIIVLLLSIAGGTNPATVGMAGCVGTILFVAGSWINSYAEYARHVWKQRPENHGQLYTGGLFRYSRHPNYLGDLLSFRGCVCSPERG